MIYHRFWKGGTIHASPTGIQRATKHLAQPHIVLSLTRLVPSVRVCTKWNAPSEKWSADQVVVLMQAFSRFAFLLQRSYIHKWNSCPLVPCVCKKWCWLCDSLVFDCLPIYTLTWGILHSSFTSCFCVYQIHYSAHTCINKHLSTSLVYYEMHILPITMWLNTSQL